MKLSRDDRAKRSASVDFEKRAARRLPPRDTLSFEQGQVISVGEELLTRCHFICQGLNKKLHRILKEVTTYESAYQPGEAPRGEGPSGMGERGADHP